MNQPKVSVIIPVYNTEKYLRECLDSVVNQTLRDIEIICVDDGSTDGSLEILREYAAKDNRLTVLTQSNSGVSSARNKGIINAAGEYIAFVDADDYIDAKTYSKAYDIAKSKNADIVVFGGKCFPIHTWADESLTTYTKSYKNDSFHALFGEPGSRPFPVNKIIRRQLLKDNNLLFDEKLSLGEDQALMFELFPLAHSIEYIKDQFYSYRQHADSAMSHFNINHDYKVKCHLKLVNHICNTWEKNGYAREHGTELAEWILNFLYNDLQNCRYNLKIDAYQEIVTIISRIIDPKLLSPRRKRQYESMLLVIDTPFVAKVTVIMPTYNAAEYLSETLRGISAQKYTNFEILFVDDGSTDSTLQILNQFVQDDRRAQIITQQHQFAGVARNTGLQQAKGEYLLFLDSDDFFSPEMIEQAVERAENTHADICVFQADRFDQKTRKKSAMPWTCNPNLCPAHDDVFSRSTNPKNIFAFTTAAPWNKLFKRSFVEKNKLYFQNTRSANDTAFVMTALAVAERIAIQNSILLTYRVNNSNSLQGSQDKKPDAFYEALLELRRRLVERNVYSEVEPAFINFALDFCLYNLGTMSTRAGFEEVFLLLKETAFHELDLIRWPKDYFYAYTPNHIYEKREDIINLSFTEYLRKYNLFEMQRKDASSKGLEAKDLKASEFDSLYSAITWALKKAQGGYYCLVENGVRYTVNHLKAKIRRRLKK